MRVIRTSGFGNVVWVAFVSAQAADGVLTYLGLHTFGAGSEGNPIVAWYMAALPAAAYQPGEDEVAAIATRDGLARALALFRLGLRSEAVREWVFSLRGLDDRQLLAASELEIGRAHV